MRDLSRKLLLLYCAIWSAVNDWLIWASGVFLRAVLWISTTVRRRRISPPAVYAGGRWLPASATRSRRGGGGPAMLLVSPGSRRWQRPPLRLSLTSPCEATRSSLLASLRCYGFSSVCCRRWWWRQTANGSAVSKQVSARPHQLISILLNVLSPRYSATERTAESLKTLIHLLRLLAALYTGSDLNNLNSINKSFASWSG